MTITPWLILVRLVLPMNKSPVPIEKCVFHLRTEKTQVFKCTYRIISAQSAPRCFAGTLLK